MSVIELDTHIRGGRLSNKEGHRTFVKNYIRSLFVLLSFLFWSLCCLSFFDLRILITPLVSSNSS